MAKQTRSQAKSPEVGQVAQPTAEQIWEEMTSQTTSNATSDNSTTSTTSDNTNNTDSNTTTTNSTTSTSNHPFGPQLGEEGDVLAVLNSSNCRAPKKVVVRSTAWDLFPDEIHFKVKNMVSGDAMYFRVVRQGDEAEFRPGQVILSYYRENEVPQGLAFIQRSGVYLFGSLRPENKDGNTWYQAMCVLFDRVVMRRYTVLNVGGQEVEFQMTVL